MYVFRVASSDANQLTFSQHVTTGADSQKNFLVVDNKTDTATIESTFDTFIGRKDIAIVLINQHASLPRCRRVNEHKTDYFWLLDC